MAQRVATARSAVLFGGEDRSGTLQVVGGVYERFDMKLCRIPLLDLVEIAAISVGRVGGFAVAELGEFLRKLVFVLD